MLALLECSPQAKALGLSSLNVEGDSANVIPQVINKESSSWKFDNQIHKIIDVVSELGCFLAQVPRSTNQVADQLAKQGDKHLAFFVGDFRPPLSVLCFYSLYFGFYL